MTLCFGFYLTYTDALKCLAKYHHVDERNSENMLVRLREIYNHDAYSYSDQNSPLNIRIHEFLDTIWNGLLLYVESDDECFIGKEHGRDFGLDWDSSVDPRKVLDPIIEEMEEKIACYARLRRLQRPALHVVDIVH